MKQENRKKRVWRVLFVPFCVVLTLALAQVLDVSEYTPMAEYGIEDGITVGVTAIVLLFQAARMLIMRTRPEKSLRMAWTVMI